MPDDVLLNKVAIVERCLRRIDEEYRGKEGDFETNLTRQDSVILNLQRACKAAVDLAMHMVNIHHLRLPQESREAFAMMQQANLLNPEISRQMQAMVGFRNIAVHKYQKLNLAIVRSIVEKHLGEFKTLQWQY